MKARAALFREIGVPLTIEEVDVDEPEEHEVLIRTAACGVCHSDLHFMRGAIAGPVPSVLGHEPAGIVEAVGSAVRSVKPGDHVIACTSMYCGDCQQCMLGRLHLCVDRDALRRKPGARARLSQNGTEISQYADLGGFAELMLLHERAVVRIDDDIPLDRAALVGCAVTTGVGAALNTARVQPGSSVAVFGCGGVGLSIVQGARIAGARQIIAVDLRADKLEIARHFGATHTVLPAEEDVVRTIKRLSGSGVDYAFDAVGHPDLISQCFYSLAPRGVAVLVGVIPRGQSMQLNPAHFYVEKTITGSYMGSTRFRIDALHYLDLYRQGRLDLDAMISGRLPLDELDDAMAGLETGEVTRSVITFGEN